MDILKYKDYEANAEPDKQRDVWSGKILLTSDLITVEAAQISEVQQELEAALDDYIATCDMLARSPQALKKAG